MNILEMLRSAKEAKKIIKDIHVTGRAGGDMVEIALNGEHEVTEVHISKEMVQPNNTQLLQDLIKAAFYDASTKLKEELQSRLGPMMAHEDILKNLMGGGR